MADDMRLEYFVDADTSGTIELTRAVDKAEREVVGSFNNMDKSVKQLGTQTTVAAREVNKGMSSMRGANGQFVKGMNDSIFSTNTLTKSIRSSLGIYGQAAGAIIGIGAAAATVAIQIAESIVQFENLANRAGVSTKTLQTWERAASGLNITADDLSQTLQDVSDRVGEFTRSGGKEGEFKDVYEQYIKPMGKSIEELKNMKPDEVLQLIHKGMTDAGASANEFKSVMEQVASNASWLLPLLEDNGAAIKVMQDEMSRKNEFLTDEQVEAARSIKESISGLNTTWDSIKRGIVVSMQEPLEDTIKFLDTILERFNQIINKPLDEQIEEKTKKLIEAEKALARRPKSEWDKSIVRGLKAEIATLEARKKSLEKSKTPSKTGGGVDIVGGDTDDSVSEREKNAIDKKAQAVVKAELEARRRALESSRASRAAVENFGAKLEEDDSTFTGISATGGTTPKLVQLANERELILELQELEYGDAKAHAERLLEIDRELASEKASIMSSMFSSVSSGFESIADVIKMAAGEQSSAYQAMFAVSKSFQLAQAGLNLYGAIMSAYNAPDALTLTQKLSNAAAIAGAAGGVMGSLQGITFGGGRLYGGPTQAGKMYRVNENGRPEMYTTKNGQQYMMGNGGYVTPASDLGGNSVVINQSFVFDGGTPNDQSTMQQFAQIAKAQTMEVLQQQMRQGGMLSR